MENITEFMPEGKHLNPSVMVANVEITTDNEGRFNLNALHKASGLGANKGPGKWLRNAQTTDLITEMENSQICLFPVSSSKGRDGGTFAHELLAVSYAGWLSPSFQLIVNQAFLDRKAGLPQPVHQIQNEGIRDLAFLADSLVAAAEQEATTLKEGIARLAISAGVEVVGVGASKFEHIASGPFTPTEEMVENKVPRFRGGPNLHRYVKAWYRERGMTLQDVAIAIGHSRATLSRAIRGKTKGPANKHALLDLKSYISGGA